MLLPSRTARSSLPAFAVPAVLRAAVRRVSAGAAGAAGSPAFAGIVAAAADDSPRAGGVRAQPRIRRRRPARTGRPSLQEQLLRLVDRNARDAGLLVDPAVPSASVLRSVRAVLQSQARRSSAAARRAAETASCRRAGMPRQRRQRRGSFLAPPALSSTLEQPAHQHGVTRRRRREQDRPSNHDQRADVDVAVLVRDVLVVQLVGVGVVMLARAQCAP